MQIEIGKSYRSQNGGVVRILQYEGGLFYCSDKCWRERDGSNSYIENYDLVSEVVDKRPNGRNMKKMFVFIVLTACMPFDYITTLWKERWLSRHEFDGKGNLVRKKN